MNPLGCDGLKLEAPTGKNLDEALLLQTLQRVAHGGAGNSQSDGHFCLGIDDIVDKIFLLDHLTKVLIGFDLQRRGNEHGGSSFHGYGKP